MQTSSLTSSLHCHRARLGQAWQRVQPVRRLRQALVMVLNLALVLTSLPVIERLTPVAQAQITQRSCDQQGAANQIFQRCKVANYGSNTEGPLEDEAINGLLSIYNLPTGDRGRLVQWERNKIRAALYSILLVAIQKAPSARTATEQTFVNSMTTLVKERRVLATTKAQDEFNKWLTNCPYTPPEGFTYNNGPCEFNPSQLFGGRNPPSFEEFLSYGALLANAEIQNNLAQQAAFKQTALALGALGGIGVAAVAASIIIPVALATLTSGFVTSVPAWIAVFFPYAFSYVSVAGALTIAGPVVAVIIALTFAIIRGIQVVTAEQLPAKLQEAKDRAMNETPNLAQLITTDEGKREIFAEFMQTTFPEFLPAGGVPAAQASDSKFRLTPGDTITPTLQYKDWDGNNHIVRLNGGWFVDRQSSDPERLTLSIDYKDWAGRRWTASRRGPDFWHSPGYENTEQAFRSFEIKYLDTSNAQMTAAIDNAAPAIWTLPVTRRQAPPSPFPTANVSQIATVFDAQDAEDSLIVTVTSANPSNGVTLSEISVGADGKVMARVQPTCTASNTTFTLQVADSLGTTDTATLNVTVTPNALPVLSYPSVNSVPLGGGLIINPATGPSDDGSSLSDPEVGGIRPLRVGDIFIAPTTPNAAPFTGTVAVSPTDAHIAVRNAGPVGEYLVATSLIEPCGITSTSFTLKVVDCGPISVQAEGTNPTCNGASNGRIQYIPSACAGTLLYTLNNDYTHLQYSPVFSGLRAGTYELFAEDLSGNVLLRRSITLSDPPPVTSHSTTVNPTCNGASNGQITVNASGGTGALLYSINNGQFQSGNVFTGLPAGGYQVVVKDANNCSPLLAENLILIQPAAISFTTAPANPTCNGASTGQITVNASGGTGALQYSKDNGATFQPSNVFNNLAAGSYQIKVKDVNNCSIAAQTVTLTQPTAISFTTASVNLTCNGVNTGQITVNASGGTGALQYSKDNGATFQPSNVFNNLAADSYQIKVKDANNCPIAAQTVTLTQPPAITFTTTPVSPTCHGASNGQLTINATGGTGALQYSINNGQSFQPSNVFTGLAAGIYNVVVKDANVCATTAQSVTLAEPTALSLTPNALSTAQAGIAFSQSLTASGGTGTKTVSLNGALPSGLSFTPAANGGTLAGTPLQLGSYPLTLTVTDQNNCTLTQNLTLTVTCPTVTLAPATLPNAQAGTPYNQQLNAAPAGGSYSYALTNGLLPQGLALTPAGVLSGTPTQTGNFNFRVTATGFGACSGFRDYQLVVPGCAAITINPTSLPGGTTGAAYNQMVSATPAGSYNFSVTSGSLPPGLTLNAATGALSGTPPQSGTFSFSIAASNGACSGTQQYTVAIGCNSITLPATLAGATMGQSFSASVAATPAGAYSYSVVAGSLPAGLTLNATTGALSGMISTSSTYNFTLKAQAANGCSATQSYTLATTCPSIALNPVSLPTGATGAAYNQSLAVTPAGNYSFAITTGGLPAGLSLNAATGVLGGTPTVQGTFNFTIKATGFGTCAGTRAYTLVIDAGACPTVSLPDLPTGSVGQFYSSALSAAPAGTYSYALTGTLPPGVTFYASAGLLYGYPTQAGAYNFSVTATSANNCTGRRDYTLTIRTVGAAMRQTARAVDGDFDGDGQTDFVVWRDKQNDWLIFKSSDEQIQEVSLGAAFDPANDRLIAGDYDGDGQADLAVFRRSNQQGEWLIRFSQDAAVTTAQWGLATDTPVPADYDGDGKTDIAVWRGAEGRWYIQRSVDGQTQSEAWGAGYAPYHDVPVPADYDGDGKTDLAVFRRATGYWFIKQSSDGQLVTRFWGLGTDVPVAADYDGDGKADLAVWRGATGYWYVVRSTDNQPQVTQWGAEWAGDLAVPGDYDGDGKCDVAVWRESEGKWYVRQSSDNAARTQSHGQRGDQPVTAKPQL